jgi:hypothetical protein
MSSLSSLVGAGIKSIQRGVQSLASNASEDVSIDAVDVDKSMLLTSASWSTGCPKAVLTDSTTVTVSSYTSHASTVLAWQVIEFY